MKKGELKLLVEFLKYRTNKPTGSVSFVIYFITVVIIVGIIGSLLSSFPVYINLEYPVSKSFYMSLVGYALTLSCSAAIDLIFVKFDDEEKVKYSEIQNGIAMSGVALLIGMILFSALSFFFGPHALGLVISVFMVMMACFAWWISNGNSHPVLNEQRRQPKVEDITGQNSELNKSMPEGVKV